MTAPITFDVSSGDLDGLCLWCSACLAAAGSVEAHRADVLAGVLPHPPDGTYVLSLDRLNSSRLST